MTDDLNRPRRRSLDKWEMYNVLLGQDLGRCRLPETLLLAKSSLKKILSRYGSAYIKPVDGFGGEGISQIVVKGGDYSWILQGKPQQRVNDLEALLQALEVTYRGTACIVQQTAPLVRHQGRPFDIRVHMQRDVGGDWVYAGDLARVAGSDSIVSNVEITQGTVMEIHEVLGRRRESVQSLRSCLQEIGHRVCRVLGRYLTINEVGLDIGLDCSHHLWLIEVNTDDDRGGPSHDLFAKLPDPRIHDQIRRRYVERLSIPKWLRDWVFEEKAES